MKVRAKWSVKINGEWHSTGDVFEVESIDGLDGAVEVVPEKKEPVQIEMGRFEEPATEAAHVQEQKASEPKPRAGTRSRRKA